MDKIKKIPVTRYRERRWAVDLSLSRERNRKCPRFEPRPESALWAERETKKITGSGCWAAGRPLGRKPKIQQWQRTDAAIRSAGRKATSRPQSSINGGRRTNSSRRNAHMAGQNWGQTLDPGGDLIDQPSIFLEWSRRYQQRARPWRRH